MKSFRSVLNRALFTLGYFHSLLVVWQRLDPDPILFFRLAVLGAITTALFDGAFDWVLRKLDKPLDKAAKPIAAALVIAFLFVLPFPVPFPVPFTVHIAGTIIVVSLLSKVGNSIIPVECFERLISRHIWVDYYPSFKALFSRFTLPSFSHRHGAYDLFPLKMSLLFYL